MNSAPKLQKKTLLEKIKAAGPGAVITSAFIGPGTITTATNAGVNFGYALVWAVIFSGIASVIIMNMASRIAIYAKKNVIQASVDLFKGNKAWKTFIFGLLLLIIVLTGFGLETGNIIGATTGWVALTGMGQKISALIIGAISLAFVVGSTPKLVERIMQVFVALMGVIFVMTAILIGPDWGQVLAGFIPSVPTGGLVTAIALIGTTIIGINLVFHSMASEEKWGADTGTVGNEEVLLDDAYFDTAMNVSLGVLMTVGLIVTTAATLYGTNTVVDSPIVFVESLQSVLGPWAKSFGAVGLILAGLSSSTATPYICGHIAARLFHWDRPNDFRPKAFASVIVIFGTIMAYFGTRPVPVILFAQAISGVSLPLIAVLFVVSANVKELGQQKNTSLQNILGFGVVIVMTVLGFQTLSNAVMSLFG